MGAPKTLAAALLVAFTTLGCQTGQLLTGHAKRLLRSPGEKLTALPERVAEEYGCDRKARPFFQLERNEIVPDRVVAGSKVNHRLVYALCATGPTNVVRGALVTRVLYAGRTVLSDRQPRYELKPGRWVVDSTLEIPGAAKVGVYAIEVAFESASVRFRNERTFAVAASRLP
jgi:hypothetical protein